jgi:ribose transport system permease protein
MTSGPTTVAATPSRGGALAARVRLLNFRDYAIVLAFAALFIALSVTSDVFLTSRNLLNILEQQAPLAIIACAGTMVVIAGGFDLSVGAIFAISGIVAAKIARLGPVEIGFVAGIAAGAGLGLVNGLIVTAGRVNSFIGTLASSLMLRGLAVLITGGLLITVSDETFTKLGQSSFLSAKISVYVLGAFALICAVLLHRTVYGRYVFAVGGNKEAARLSGIHVDRIICSTFVLSGLAAGIAGILAASRVATGQADAGGGLELAAIAAIVLGGTSIMGGEGAIWRTLVGVFLLALIGNGFNLLNINPTYQDVVSGAIILFAVSSDAWARRSGGRRKKAVQ